MVEGHFTPSTSKITLTLECKKCGCVFTTDSFEVPTPNLDAENQEDSIVCEEYDFCCECDETCNCKKEYTINIYSGMYDGYFDIDDDDELELIDCEEEVEEESVEEFEE